MAELPPGVYEESGLFYRDVERYSPDGSTRTKKRPVALTQGEAKMRHWDWYHPVHGWVLEGYKLEKDREADILADGSTVVVATPERQMELAEKEGV
ncbi:hypothetical protein LCGC14_2804550 [marine sediment metagenome]|uniref:Uncharacterized protein n=1 Tax=marine sediment metagenome TaxID=412755 RepID=A0A0F9AV18_9ZZZZ